MLDLPTGVVTFLFSDVEASTRMLEVHRAQAGVALARHHELLAGEIATAGGVVFETVGDAVYAAFTRPADALGAAIAIQRGLAAQDWGPVGTMRVRIAVHSGAVDARDDHYFGAALFECARLQSLAHGGQTVTSAATASLATAGLPSAIRLAPMGRHRLKDLAAPMEVVQVDGEGLPTHFPPLRSSAAVPTNLPRSLSSFIGRDQDLARVDAQLERSRLVSVIGPGGTGKTRLAVEAARTRLDRYPDGVFLVDLAPILDPALVAGAIGGTLGVLPRPGETDEDALAGHLADRDMLLILDNWEQVIEGAALVGRLLETAPRLTVLATSRIPLRVRGETRIRLSPLELASDRDEDMASLGRIPAIRLFVERAREAAGDFELSPGNAADVVHLCQALDGLPLALELAAARADLLSPAAMVRGLAEHRALLRGGSDLPERQRTLLDTVGWSLDLLAPVERDLFVRLGVFAGSFPLRAAEAVAPSSERAGDGDILASLSSIADASLLVPVPDPGGEPRFTMLETVRASAIQRLAATPGAERIHEHHAEWVADLAEAGERGIHGPDPLRALQTLDLHLGDIRAAIDWCVDARRAEPAARTVGAMWIFWLLRSMIEEALRSSRLALALDPPPRLRGRVLNTMGIMHGIDDTDLSMEPFAAARQAFASAVELLETGGRPEELADVVNNLAIATQFQGDLAGARTIFERSVRLWQLTDDLRGQAIAVGNIAVVSMIEGDYAGARVIAERALSLTRRVDSPLQTAIVLQVLGRVAMHERDWSSAGTELAESARILRSLSDYHQLPSVMDYLTAVRLERPPGDPAGAARLMGATDRWYRSRRHNRPPDDLPVYEAARAALLAVLGRDAFDRAIADGATLDDAAAVRYALGEEDPFSISAAA
jgi:predicted ATPase/class 3 adenylate cyclase